MDKYEHRVRSLFLREFGLVLWKIPESDEATPDFELRCGGSCVAVLEVKAIESTIPALTAQELASIEVIEGIRDNGAARVASKIHAAVRQLRASDRPRILVLLNEDDTVDKFDLQESLVGFLSDGDKSISTLPPSGNLRTLYFDGGPLGRAA